MVNTQTAICAELQIHTELLIKIVRSLNEITAKLQNDDHQIDLRSCDENTIRNDITRLRETLITDFTVK